MPLQVDPRCWFDMGFRCSHSVGLAIFGWSMGWDECNKVAECLQDYEWSCHIFSVVAGPSFSQVKAILSPGVPLIIEDVARPEYSAQVLFTVMSGLPSLMKLLDPDIQPSHYSMWCHYGWMLLGLNMQPKYWNSGQQFLDKNASGAVILWLGAGWG